MRAPTPAPVVYLGNIARPLGQATSLTGAQRVLRKYVSVPPTCREVGNGRYGIDGVYRWYVGHQLLGGGTR